MTIENDITPIHRQKSTRSRTCSTSSTSESSTLFTRGSFVGTCRHSSFCRRTPESIDKNLQCEPSITENMRNASQNDLRKCLGFCCDSCQTSYFLAPTAFLLDEWDPNKKWWLQFSEICTRVGIYLLSESI